MRAATVLVCGASLGFLSACRDDEPGICRIRYEQIGGVASGRYDLLHYDDATGVLVREVYNDGALTEAIYYAFDDQGRLVVEALDRRANGDIESRLDAQEAIGDVLLPMVVDVDLQDGQVDALQLSLAVPTGSIGPWQPARVFFQLPCDQGATTVESQPGGTLEVGFTIPASDGTLEGSGAREGALVTVRRDERGAPADIAIDFDRDGVIDDTATLAYNPDGLVTSVAWLRANRFLGRLYANAKWTYDTDGNLYAWDLDADGDGVFESRITYGASCYNGGEDGL